MIFGLIGTSGTLTVFNDRVELECRQSSLFSHDTRDSNKTIPFVSISGLNFKECGRLAGYFQCVVKDGDSSNRYAVVVSAGGIVATTADDNAFVLDSENALALDVKRFIEMQIAEPRTPRHEATK